MTSSNVSRSGEMLSQHLVSSMLPVTVLISAEAIVGFFGNIAILLVYSKQYRHVNFRYFVLSLAFVDLVSCCTVLPAEVYSLLNWYDYNYMLMCKVEAFFNVFTVWGSATVLLVLAIDRYRKVCHPCDWQIRLHVAFRLCFCCVLISALVSIPIIILWGTQSYLYEFQGKNFTVSVCEKSGDYANTIYPLVYIICVSTPVMLIIIASMSLNFKTVWQLFGHHSVESQSVSHHFIKGRNSVQVRPGISDESNITEDDITTERTNRFKKPNENLGKSVSVSRKNLPGVSKENPQNNIVQIQELSSDIFCADEDFSSDFESRTVSVDDKKALERQNRILKRKKRTNYRHIPKFHRRNKTMIILILTSIFAVTVTMYIVLGMFVTKPSGILKDMSDTNKPVFFFFWRLYFINSVVNPILYGFMDPEFRSGFMHYIEYARHHL